MKIFSIVTVLSFLLTSAVNASELKFPEGEFSCSLNYKEYSDIFVAEGDDFPTFNGHYDQPIEKKVKLNISFSMNEGKPAAFVKNPEVLPNWLLINESEYQNQESWGYVSEEESGIFYQVSWNHTWYFGSGIDILTKAFDGRTLKVDIRLNDNDSTGELHEWVKCRKL